VNAQRARIWIGYAVICFVWGSTWLAIKIGLQSVPPLIAAGVRFLIASAILLTILKLRGISIPSTPETRKLYASLVVMSYTIPFALVYWGQQFIPSGLSSILFAVYPFWVAIFSHVVLPFEKLNIFKVAGIAFGFVGLVIIFSKDITWSDSRGILGMMAVLMCTVLQAYSLVLVKKYGQPVSPFAMNFVGMLIGGTVLLALGLLTESTTDIVWNGPAVGSILYLAVVGSVVAFVTYHWLLKHMEAVYLSLASFINPIIAVILGAVVLNEKLASTVFVGASLVLFGILVANGKYLYAKLRKTW
jgi:drug/metabolite transporter (DMT)-like permease